MDPFSRHAIRLSVAHICQIIGYTSIQSSPLEILTDLLSEYISALSKIAARYAMLFGQTEPNLHHVALAFKDMGISISELEEYVTYVESNSVLQVPKYPLSKESHLNHLKPGSREVLTRPVHIHEHLPPMHPHLEDQEYLISKSPLTVDINSSDSLSPLSSPKGVFKKPGDPVSSDPRRRQQLEDEIRPLREISSVMMTTSGFLSPAREGKLPEVRGTLTGDFAEPPSPPSPPPSPPPVSQPPPPPPPAISSAEPPLSPPNPLQTPSQTGQPSSTNTSPVTDTKPEPKKKKTKSTDPTQKKSDKENKTKEDGRPDDKDATEDETKTKKSLPMKETSKLKSLKTGSKLGRTPSPNSPSPPLKKSKSSPDPSQTPVSKTAKIKSPKGDKHPLSPSVKDTDTDFKITSEPDKQKLNIFKKITKVKEDGDEGKSVLGSRESNDTSGEDLSVKKKDYEDFLGPGNDMEIISEDPPFSGLLASLQASANLKNLESKKKKKDKQKDKKINQIEKESSKKKCIESGAPKEAIVNEKVETASPVKSGFGLVGNSTETGQPSPTAATIPSNPPPPSLPSTTLLPTTTLTSTKKKEKKKDKKLKDKIRKKKDKKEKSKNKEKIDKKKLKLEKKEKGKLKAKKEKKEKKKDKAILPKVGFEESHIPEDVLQTLTPWPPESPPAHKKPRMKDEESSSQVPKITFKLTPTSPTRPNQTNSPRKIIIKPIIKKDEEMVVNAPRLEKDETEGEKPAEGQSELTLASCKLFKSSAPKAQKIVEPVKTEGILLPPPPPPVAPTHPTVPKWEEDPNKVWICPACGRPDDGSPMIACDWCDLWYHWTCEGISEEIESDWYCKKCISKKEDGLSDRKKKHRKKKTKT